jgi:hypothetical protein
MRFIKFTISTLTIFGVTLFASCISRQQPIQKHNDTLIRNTKTVDFKLTRPLQVGDKIELSGGYDYDPLFLKNPPASKRSGTVIQFIRGQNESPAAVVKLDQSFSGEKITGDIVVLELRHVGQTWQEPAPVHIELCDFMPEDKTWKDRKQGEWVEAAASVTIVTPKN